MVSNGASFNAGNGFGGTTLTGDAIFNGSAQLGLASTLIGNAVFNNNSFINGFNGLESGTVTGTAIFNNTSTNFGAVQGGATFNDSSVNDNDGGGHGFGVVGGNSTFNGSSYNRGTVTNATFNGSSHNDLNVIGSAVFNGSTYNNNNATVSGSATFNDQSHNEHTISQNATFNGSSYNHGTVSGSATFTVSTALNKGAVSGDVTFTYVSTTTLPISGNFQGGYGGTLKNGSNNAITEVIFYGAAINSATFNANAIFNDNSINQGSVGGNGTFLDSSKNKFANVSGNACFSPTATNTGAVGGTITVCSPLSAPTVVAGTASRINNTTYLIYGSINNTGGESSTTAGINYGPTNSYGTTKSSSGTFNSGDFGFVVSGLTCGTAYHFQAFATNAVGTTNASDSTFTTSSCSTPEPILYGVDGGGRGPNSSNAYLYTLDPATGSKLTTIGRTGAGLVSLAFNPISGTLYGSSGGAGSIHPKSLFTVNTTTGAATFLGAIKDGATAITMPDLAFDSNGTLYSVSGSNGNLYSLNISLCDGTTCPATLVGKPGPYNSGQGIEFDSNGNLLWFGQYDNSYDKLDKNTGSIITDYPFGNASGNYYPISGATYDGNLLFTSLHNYGSSPSSLVVIDTNDNKLISMGDNPDMLYMEGIAFYNPPAPPAGGGFYYTNSSNGSITKVVGGQQTILQPPTINNPTTPPAVTPPTTPVPPVTPASNTIKHYDFGTKAIKLGSKGQYCLAWQNFFNDHGYPLTLDGNCGKLTITAAKSWQKLMGLKPDGILGVISRNKAQAQ